MNKEEIDIDVIIANEIARVECGQLATDRADCIAFIGSKYEDTVGLPSAKIVENLIKDVSTGELNNAGTTNSFSAYFGAYKEQYDPYNDKMRYVSVAGDCSGKRCQVNASDGAWYANAGISRGQLKKANKLSFNPNKGQRDFMYKNRINPVVSLPGAGNAINKIVA